MFKKTDWLKVFNDMGIIERGTKEKPLHWKMASGKHSDVRVDIRKLEACPSLYRKACRDLWKKACPLFKRQCYHTSLFVGPAQGGNLLAYELAYQAGMEFARTAKKNDVWKIDGEGPYVNATVGLCDDVITTGGSLVSMGDLLEGMNCRIANPICTLVNRSGSNQLHLYPNREGLSYHAYFNYHPIVALVELNEPGWEPEKCPQCKMVPLTE